MTQKQEPTIHAAFIPFVEAKAALDAKIKHEGETAVKVFFKDYFDTHPEIYGIRWDQFVPYFNDGDACTFGLGGVASYKTKKAFDVGTSAYDDDNEDIQDCYNEEPHTSLQYIEDILEVVFGEHAQVAVTRTSIESEEYTDHD